MSVRQLSVYVENKKGSLANITDILAQAGVDLRSMCIADTKDFGILRIIADDTQKALDTLKAAGQTANIREVVAFAVPDKRGGLATILALLSENDINLEYAYAIITSDKDNAYIVMRVDDNGKTEKVLRDHNVRILSEEDL